MITFVTIKATLLDPIGRRIAKFVRLGAEDVQTAPQVAPFGDDGNPPEGMKAIYAPSQQKGKPVILGYINKGLLAEAGEKRIFSMDENGEVATYIWLKKDGTIELGGSTDFIVRFNDLKSGFDELKTDFNNLVTKFNAHMHPTAGNGPPSTPTNAPAASSNASIDDSKISGIKTL